MIGLRWLTFCCRVGCSKSFNHFHAIRRKVNKSVHRLVELIEN
jgi:hypothetical protein